MATFGEEVYAKGEENVGDTAKFTGDANNRCHLDNSNTAVDLSHESEKDNLMTMSTPPHLLSSALRSPDGEATIRQHRRHFNNSRNTSILKKEREERVRKVKEQQEEERRKKLEELKHHAMLQQKFREQQEFDRRRHFEEARARDQDKHSQVEERRRAIEMAERDRRALMLKKNMEREEKILAKKRAQQSQINFAFGSSTPRMPPADARRSTSSTNVQMTQSMYTSPSQRRSVERDPPTTHSKARRTTSAHGLDKTADEGEDALMSKSFHTPGSAHRRRTDLLPVVTRSSVAMGGLSRASTPGGPKAGGSTSSRSPSAMSGSGTGSEVRMRASGPRKPRPTSIATTGIMSTSMYERRTTNSNVSTPTRPPSSSANEKFKRNKDDDNRSNSSNNSASKVRRTPAQVKADSAARKLSKANKPDCGSPKNDGDELGNSDDEAISPRQPTPDIISGGKEKRSPVEEEQNNFVAAAASTATPAKKNIIASEEEAKARLAEKRREIKEKKEREAELERQRQAELDRLEAERLAREEEEERKAIEEAEKLAEEARRLEEERLQKAIEEAQKREEEDRRRKAEEDRLREEAERKSAEEAERKKAALEEKLKKDEEERQARKKRIEEIMLRTRKKDTPADNGHKNGDANANSEATHSSLDPVGDPTKPDLLGDLGHDKSTSGAATADNGSNNSYSNNNNNNNNNVEAVALEKGVVDMNISEQAKETDDDLMNAKNEAQPLLDFEGPVGFRQSPSKALIVDGQPVFDQILDLSSEPAQARDDELVPAGPPIIAFEDSISNKQEVPTADLLS